MRDIAHMIWESDIGMFGICDMFTGRKKAHRPGTEGPDDYEYVSKITRYSMFIKLIAGRQVNI